VLNITGKWSGNFMGGTEFQLQQTGALVWGTFSYGNGEGLARGRWSDAYLLLVLTPFDTSQGGQCSPRFVLTIKNQGVITKLTPQIYDLGGGYSSAGIMSRISPDAGPSVAYPYDAELRNCGQLFTYELAFESGSDKLLGTDWPLLAAIAAVLKQDPDRKIQVAGHTDATGDAASNQRLSVRRAQAVKAVLVQHYGVDSTRVTTIGYGPDQPIGSNQTEDGRAMNRRVELVLAR
jgi:outer membrane protein OmpA-like peptidoglycan-associated protein